jgi:hypothetical protein
VGGRGASVGGRGGGREGGRVGSRDVSRRTSDSALEQNRRVHKRVNADLRSIRRRSYPNAGTDAPTPMALRAEREMLDATEVILHSCSKKPPPTTQVPWASSRLYCIPPLARRVRAFLAAPAYTTIRAHSILVVDRDIARRKSAHVRWCRRNFSLVVVIDEVGRSPGRVVFRSHVALLALESCRFRGRGLLGRHASCVVV